MSKIKQHKAGTLKGLHPVPWLTAVVMLLGIAIIAGIHWRKSVVVNEIRFVPGTFVDSGDLKNKFDMPTGVPIDSLNLLNMIEEIETIDYVKNASINLEPSGNILIEFSERRPIALLANGEDKIYLDEEGVRLPVIPGQEIDVPILYGFSTKPMNDTLKSDAWQRVRRFLTAMQQQPVGNATISEVAWIPDRGIVALSHEEGVRLFFGKEDFGTRLRNWSAFYSEIVREKGMKTMQYVDLRFRGQIVTREG